MYFDTTLLWLLGLGALAWFWHANLQVRERATRAARRTCEADGVQFLEETVALRRMRPCRDARGRLVWCRLYQFDYSVDGATRQQGFVHFTGRRMEGVGLAREGGHE
ncbi:MAG: DUF3301 domain-containing protein [Gammaproteobacteria bacterium]|nr:DUF3301 domain-containing protein [Gammaproteobacteria bacterium]